MNKTLLALLITVASFAPMKKADAGILLAVFGVTDVPQTAAIIFLGGGIALVGDGQIKTKQGRRIARSVGIGLIALDEKQEEMERVISSFAPTAPTLLVEDIAKAFSEKSKRTQSIKAGLKMITLERPSALKILKDYDFLEDGLKTKLFHLMTDKLKV